MSLDSELCRIVCPSEIFAGKRLRKVRANYTIIRFIYYIAPRIGDKSILSLTLPMFCFVFAHDLKY